MVRFKVIKGSHILLALSVAVLITILLFALISINKTDQVTDIIERSASSAIAAIADDAALQIEILPDPTEKPAQQNKKQILIYHTHTHEAYAQNESDPYIAIETWRTEDQEHSVVKVGAALAEELRNKGFNVIHDTTDHELEDLNQAYIRSLETLQGYKQDFDLCIDLHRDAYIEGMPEHLHTEVGFNYAQTMVLIGQAVNFQIEEQPNYDTNLKFAQEVTNSMNQIIPGICRNVTVKYGRYNQHIGKLSMLVEVGHNRNSLQEALATIPCLADAIATSLS